MTSEKQWRATFEDTKKNQEDLRETLDYLIKDKRPIKDEQERKQFIELLSNSTIGLGTEPVKIRLDDKTMVEIKNLEQFISELLYVDAKVVSKNFFWFLTGKSLVDDVPIEQLWLNVRRHLFAVFPLAKASTIKISKEREKKEFSPGASLDDV